MTVVHYGAELVKNNKNSLSLGFCTWIEAKNITKVGTQLLS
jgi:hypothetical protein